MMQQRISVRAIIKHQNEYLLFKRRDGRDSIIGRYELLGGRVESGEQPEDALRRHLKDSSNLTINNFVLDDVVSYVDHADRSIHYAVITYLVILKELDQKIILGLKYNKYKWIKLQNLQQIETTDLTALLLGILQHQHSKTVNPSAVINNDEKITTKFEAIIYSDGGSRGNPGPSAAGYVILDHQQNIIEQGGEYLGLTTNNQAEYQGLRLGLEAAIRLKLKKIDFRLDSMMVVNQMNGVFAVKNRELWPVHERIRQLLTQFDKVSFSHVKREFNQLADGLVNKTLDEHRSNNKK